MQSLISDFLSLPIVVISAIFGAIGGALGFPLGIAASKFFKSKKLTQALPIVVAVIFVVVPSNLVGHWRNDLQAKQVISGMKERRVFSTIFRLHPDSEEDMQRRIQQILSESNRDDVKYKVISASSELVSKYYFKYILLSSDESVRKALEREVRVLRQLQQNPEACVSYFLGKPAATIANYGEDFISAESDFKADIIEAAYKHPSIPPRRATVEELIPVIADSYRKKGYDQQNLEKVSIVSTLSPTEGCRIGFEFTDALASLESNKAAFVYKNLIRFAEIN